LGWHGSGRDDIGGALLRQVPRHGLPYSFADSVSGCIAEFAGSFADIRLGVAYVSGSKVSVLRGFGVVDTILLQCISDGAEQLVEGGAVPYCHVVYLVAGFRVGGGCRQQVDLHGVVDVAEVAAGFAVAVDKHVFAFDHRRCPFGDHGGVGAFRVLAFAEYVEVAQADGGEAVGFGEYIGVEFVDVFGDGIGRQGFADHVFHLGQAGVVAVGGAAGGIDKAFDLGIAGGHQHVEKAVDIGGVGG